MKLKSKYGASAKFLGLLALLFLFAIFGPFAFVTLFFGLIELYKKVPAE